ncbi:hypothetical protein JZ751_029735 [Albula glossodonta]|uniref:Ig-like domain-containing protein n=1 Tax=Albula glossodonta TaxID=121402 RepID=A0A8T2NB28_9TELE|nr:hypothetical protein JZ751_029735 [Albula glossodonta]
MEEMNLNLLPVFVILSAGLHPVVRSQDPVQIQFQTDPVLVRTGSEAVLTVVVVPDVWSVSWESPAKDTLGQYVVDLGSAVNTVAQYEGRLTITPTQLRIRTSQLRDAGNYTVTVTPSGTTGLGRNSRSVELRVFDAVAGVSLFVPSVAVEGGNVSLSCTWTAGTETKVIWGKGGTALTSDSRVTISGGSLVINPARRGDAGEYTCTVSNPVSAKTAIESLTVFYGPDTPRMDQDLQADCVGGGQAVVGQTVRLTCQSDSLPPALFSWQHEGEPVASGQPDSGVLSIQTFSTNQSGRYVCVARNAVTGRTSEQGTDVTIVRTCLSPGAVAGIVIGCILALILIIIAIVLLLRWRKVDMRLRRAEANPKPEENPQHRSQPVQPTLPQPRNHVPPHNFRNRPHGDHQMHDLGTLQHVDQFNGYTLPPNGLHDVDTVQQNGRLNSNTFPQNGLVNPNTLPHNGQLNSHTFQPNGHLNTNTFPQNTPQQNPNIVIQTGQGNPNSLAPTVHVNLNTLPNGNQLASNAQPHTVHLNLNTYPHANQQDPHSMQHANQHNNQALQLDNQHAYPTQQRANQPNNNQHNNRALQHTDNLDQAGHSDRAPLMQNGVPYPTSSPRVNPRAVRDPAGNGRHRSGDLVQTGYSHPVNPAPAGHRGANAQPYPDEGRHHNDRERDTRRHQRTQMPWDHLRGTPAYPNYGFEDDSDTDDTPSGAESRPHVLNSGRPPHDSAPTGRGQPSRETRAASRSPRERGQMADPRRRTQSGDRNTQRADPDISAQLVSPQNRHDLNANHAPGQTHLAPQSRNVQGPMASQGPTRQPASGQLLPAGQTQVPSHNALQQRRLQESQIASPLAHTGLQNLDEQARLVAQNQRIPQNPRQTVPQNANGQVPQAAVSGQVPSGLTQAALQTHMAHTHNPFRSRNHQTWAALQSPTTQPQSRPTGTGPALNPQAHPATTRRPPTPPPVLPPNQFQTLPRQPVQRPPPQQHLAPPRHPGHPTHPNRQRHPQHIHGHPTHGHPTAQRHHGNVHMHPNQHGHPNTHRHPTNHRQDCASALHVLTTGRCGEAETLRDDFALPIRIVSHIKCLSTQS